MIFARPAIEEEDADPVTLRLEPVLAELGLWLAELDPGCAIPSALMSIMMPYGGPDLGDPLRCQGGGRRV